MKAKPLIISDLGYEECSPSEATHLKLHLPGPFPIRILPIMIGDSGGNGTINWVWDGSVDTPTLYPSILTKGNNETGEHVCHSWINKGKVQFLNDCTHDLACKIVDLYDV